jgi:dipeptidyl aminopeptidase/acylaminoacyl peptidase
LTRRSLAIVAALLAAPATRAASLTPADLRRLQAVGEVDISPDGRRIAYAVRLSDGPGRPRAESRLLDVASGQGVLLAAGRAGNVRFSPDGRRLAYFAPREGGTALYAAQADGSAPVLLAPVVPTNHPLPSAADPLAWSGDGERLAFVSSTPGPEPPAGDPVVITRYLYKPFAGPEFNDNRRLHVFLVDVGSRAVRPLTDGPWHDHSVAFAPGGREVYFVSNREADPDRVFNNDIFAVDVASKAVRRVTDTRAAEYEPRPSPDGRRLAFLGTRRELTSSETTMEDDHLWLSAPNGADRRELGALLDNRQGAPRWSADGRHVHAAVQERGAVFVYRFPLDGGRPERVAGEDGARVGAFALAGDGALAYAMTTPGSPAELYLTRDGRTRRLTSLNDALLRERVVAPVEAFRFPGEGGLEIEAFLTRPAAVTAGSRHPLIVAIHGGPHGQQGPAFDHRAQVYAAQGWATLMVNYRGSTGYGQKLADAVFGDQNGAEARDVLLGVDEALRLHPWLDPERLGLEGGSYGGQLANWIVTQTDRFRAAIPSASISNLVSFNYTAYYHDYLAVEFGAYPHEKGLMDRLWERSPLRHVARVKTPVLLLHGEEDNDVPIAESEQFFIALKDVGVETVLVRYPREGHGLRETAHVIDALERSLDWYRRHFAAGPAPGR